MVAMHKGKRHPVNVSPPDFIDILQGQRTGCEVAGIGIIFTGFHDKLFKVIIGDNRFTADDKMAPVPDSWQDAVDSLIEMGDISADMAISPGDNFTQPAIIIGDDKRQTVKLPAHPDGSAISPFHQIFRLFRLG